MGETPDRALDDLSRLDPRPFSSFEELACGLVELDAALGEQPRHRIVGYRGEDPLAVIDLRPFPPGAVQAPVVEALAGLLALGADRIAAAMPGRAWSVDDPIVPVVGDADLRVRVLVLTTARDGSSRSWLRPFDLQEGRLRWHDTLEDVGDASGWVHDALATAAAAGWEPDAAAAREQLARCVRLGHAVMLAPAGAAVLG